MVFQCEFDKKTALAYDTIHGETLNLGDVTTVHALTGDLKVDLLMVSPPCQDISVAGKGAGLGEGTRSGLIYDIVRIIRETPAEDRPKILVWEDVPALVGSKYIDAWNGIIEDMHGLGYTTVWKVLNAADYGVAQSRKRMFAISKLGDETVEMPKPFPLTKRMKDYLQPNSEVDDSYFLSQERVSDLVWSDKR